MMAALLQHPTRDWRMLDFPSSYCDDDSLCVLANAPRLRHLSWLSFAYSQGFGERGVKALLESPYLSPACTLDFSGVRLSNAIKLLGHERLGKKFKCSSTSR
jgi:hypothetical protein